MLDSLISLNDSIPIVILTMTGFPVNIATLRSLTSFDICTSSFQILKLQLITGFSLWTDNVHMIYTSYFNAFFNLYFTISEITKGPGFSTRTVPQGNALTSVLDD